MTQIAVITLHDVRVRLSGREILRGVDAVIPTGCVVGLVGPNGAGKSTLLRAASGQVPLSGGRVAIAGESIERMSHRQLARSVCLLPQNTSLTFPFAVRDIVAMGRNPHLSRFQAFGERDKHAVLLAMRQATVEHLADRSVTKLSGGEQQRVLLARCLATEAPTLLLDEPTASLDILHQLELLELLKQFAGQDKTVVAALHDLNIARRICSHIILLLEGKVVADGLPEETLNPANVERVFGVRVAAEYEDGLRFALPDKRNT
jgi:iron complex transport system ATP-binding protein